MYGRLECFVHVRLEMSYSNVGKFCLSCSSPATTMRPSTAAAKTSPIETGMSGKVSQVSGVQDPDGAGCITIRNAGPPEVPSLWTGFEQPDLR